MAGCNNLLIQTPHLIAPSAAMELVPKTKGHRRNRSSPNVEPIVQSPSADLDFSSSTEAELTLPKVESSPCVPAHRIASARPASSRRSMRKRSKTKEARSNRLEKFVIKKKKH